MSLGDVWMLSNGDDVIAELTAERDALAERVKALEAERDYQAALAAARDVLLDDLRSKVRAGGKRGKPWDGVTRLIAPHAGCVKREAAERVVAAWEGYRLRPWAQERDEVSAAIAALLPPSAPTKPEET